MKFRIRLAAKTDIPVMHSIRLNVVENRLSDSSLLSEDDYLPFVLNENAWIAETSSGLVGFAAVDADAGSVWALFVDSDAEGLGVGRALHERLMEWAAAREVIALSLNTERRSRAHRFYVRAGWKEGGTTSNDEVLLVRDVEPEGYQK